MNGCRYPGILAYRYTTTYGSKSQDKAHGCDKSKVTP